MATAVATGTDPVTIVFESESGQQAVSESTVSTTDENTEVTFAFEVVRSPLTFSVGAASGEQGIVNETSYGVGTHVVSFTPMVASYVLQWKLKGEGKATLQNFRRLNAGPLELATPYAATDVSKLRYAQSLNVMWFTQSDGTIAPQVLQRRGNTSWSMLPFAPENGPFGGRNTGDITMFASARTGEVQITSSEALFASYDVGGLLRLETPGQAVIEDFTGVDQTTGSIRVTGIEGSRAFSITLSGTFTGTIVLERSVGNELSWQTVNTYFGPTNTSYNDGYDNQVIFYRLRMTAFTSGSATVDLTYGAGFTEGTARILSVDADNQVTADVIKPFANTGSTAIWSFGAWSGRFGYPQATALADGRLWMLRRSAYWGSASDNFYDFEIGTLADQAISRTIGGPMNKVEWAAGVDGKLLVGLRGSEVNIGSNAFEEVITPANARSRVRTSRGSYDTNEAVVDDHAVFISRSRQRLYRFGYNPDRSDYDAFHLTRLNRQLGKDSPFRQVVYQYEPEPRLWIVREDGQAVCFVYDLEEGVFAFSRYKINGKIRSVCTLPGQPEDTVLFLVEREINGATQRGIERLADQEWTSLADCCRLHGALTYSGASTTTLSGLEHLEGREVYVWNGRQQGPYTVAGGSIALNKAVTSAIVGELYEGRYKSPRLAAGTISNWRQIKRLAFWIYQTAGGAFKWGRDFENMDVMKAETGGTLNDGPLNIFEEDQELPFDGGSDRDPRLCISMHTAGPCTILALAPQITSNER